MEFRFESQCFTTQEPLNKCLSAEAGYTRPASIRVSWLAMSRFVALFRGLNVGGKNKVPMATLQRCLEELGFANVLTYIASGNVILNSDKNADEIKSMIEGALPKQFDLDNEIVKVLVLTDEQLRAVVENRPPGFGGQPDTYHSDAIFLIDIDVSRAMPIFSPREGVDSIWAGDGVIYSQRLSSQRTKSRLNKIMGTPEYRSMTIRSWNTTIKLFEMIKTNP